VPRRPPQISHFGGDGKKNFSALMRRPRLPQTSDQVSDDVIRCTLQHDCVCQVRKTHDGNVFVTNSFHIFDRLRLSSDAQSLPVNKISSSFY